MSKYRIVKRGETECYMVQERILGFFWVPKMGSVIYISLKEAREYRKLFEDGDIFQQKLNAKNKVVE